MDIATMIADTLAEISAETGNPWDSTDTEIAASFPLSADSFDTVIELDFSEAEIDSALAGFHHDWILPSL